MDDEIMYTLRAPLDGNEGAILNGHIFYVRRMANGSIYFIDAQTKLCLCVTEPAVDVRDLKDGLTITTKSSSYGLVDVFAVIPTARKTPKKKLCPITKTVIGDLTEFTFNDPITEEEFKSYLKRHGYQLRNKIAWYDYHSRIMGSESGRSWIYEWTNK